MIPFPCTRKIPEKPVLFKRNYLGKHIGGIFTESYDIENYEGKFSGQHNERYSEAAYKASSN